MKRLFRRRDAVRDGDFQQFSHAGAELHRRLTAFTQAQQSTPAAQGEIDDQVVEHLRSLGYVD